MAYCCKNLLFVILGKGQFKVKVKIEGEKHIYIIPAKHSYHYLSSIVIGLWDMSVWSGTHQWHKSFVTLEKGQFMVKVKIEDEKHIYVIPAKHSYHYLSSIGLWDMSGTKWYLAKCDRQTDNLET